MNKQDQILNGPGRIECKILRANISKSECEFRQKVAQERKRPVKMHEREFRTLTQFTRACLECERNKCTTKPKP